MRRELLRLGGERARADAASAGSERDGDLARGRDVHGGRKGVVRRLAHVDVVVRMHRRLGAELAAEQLVGAVGDDLVDVHVGLGAGAGLPDHQREMVVELAVDDLVRRRATIACARRRVEQAELVVDLGGGALDDASARISGSGMRSVPMRKFCRERWVCAPQ